MFYKRSTDYHFLAACVTKAHTSTPINLRYITEAALKDLEGFNANIDMSSELIVL